MKFNSLKSKLVEQELKTWSTDILGMESFALGKTKHQEKGGFHEMVMEQVLLCYKTNVIWMCNVAVSE